MKYFQILFTAIALLSAATDAAADITFKRSPQYNHDTVSNSRYYLVCLTDPGNLAAINGEQVKVYKTGAFGRQLRLVEGDNRIEVTLFQGQQVETKEVHIYYRPNPGLSSQPAPEPQLEEGIAFSERTRDRERTLE